MFADDTATVTVGGKIGKATNNLQRDVNTVRNCVTGFLFP